jgi:hypothetical protein
MSRPTHLIVDREQRERRGPGIIQRYVPSYLLPIAMPHLLKFPPTGDQSSTAEPMGDISSSNHNRKSFKVQNSNLIFSGIRTSM